MDECSAEAGLLPGCRLQLRKVRSKSKRVEVPALLGPEAAAAQLAITCRLPQRSQRPRLCNLVTGDPGNHESRPTLTLTYFRFRIPSISANHSDHALRAPIVRHLDGQYHSATRRPYHTTTSSLSIPSSLHNTSLRTFQANYPPPVLFYATALTSVSISPLPALVFSADPAVALYLRYSAHHTTTTTRLHLQQSTLQAASFASRSESHNHSLSEIAFHYSTITVTPRQYPIIAS